MVFGKEEKDEAPPIEEVKTLQILYFPELEVELCGLELSYVRLNHFASSQRAIAYRDREKWTAEWDVKSKEFLQHRMDHSRCAEALLNKCSQLLKLHPPMRPPIRFRKRDYVGADFSQASSRKAFQR